MEESRSQEPGKRWILAPPPARGSRLKQIPILFISVPNLE